MSTSVQCKIHRHGEETFVCQHIGAGLLRRQRVGFFWAADDTEVSRPDAWCSACNDRVARQGGEWEGEALAQLRAKLMCGHCYDEARLFHSGVERRRAFESEASRF